MSSYRSLWVLVWCAGCSASADPETFAAQWLRALADGKAERAFQQLCPDARPTRQLEPRRNQRGARGLPQEAGGALRRDRFHPDARGELRGRRPGDQHQPRVLPMRLRRQAKTFCVTLPEPEEGA